MTKKTKTDNSSRTVLLDRQEKFREKSSHGVFLLEQKDVFQLPDGKRSTRRKFLTTDVRDLRKLRTFTDEEVALRDFRKRNRELKDYPLVKTSKAS